MSEPIRLLGEYLKYYNAAKTVYNVHSPFVYEFMTDVFDTSRDYYAYGHLEHERRMLLKNQNTIKVLDLGAGSKTKEASPRKISDIASKSLSNPWKSRLLFQLVNKYKPDHILELGTSLGISALYMSAARHATKIRTIEGSPEVANIAKIVLERNKCVNAKVLTGEFDTVLPQALSNLKTIDMVHLDGNHTYEATVLYFQQILPSMSDHGFFVVDDIRWSSGMIKAWHKIISDPKITLSLDLGTLGIVFLNPELSKQSIALVEFYKKPWRIGLF